MTGSPENGGCRDRAQRHGFRGHFEPLSQISILKGVLHSVHVVSCKASASTKPQATRWTLGISLRGRGSRAPSGLSGLWNPVISAILVTARGIPGAE